MSDEEQLDRLAGIDDSLIAHLTKNGYALTEYKIYFEGKQEEGMRDIIGVTALQTLLSWHQQELDRAVAEVKETHKHNYHLGEFSGQKLVFKADGSISHWEYASAHFVCDCGDFKYVLDKKEGK